MELLRNDYYEAIPGSARKLSDNQSGTDTSCSNLNNIQSQSINKRQAQRNCRPTLLGGDGITWKKSKKYVGCPGSSCYEVNASM